MTRTLSMSALLAVGLAMTALPALASPARTTMATPFLDGPAADYARIGNIAAGARVDVLWCGTRDNYCLVTRLGTKGWVPAAALVAATAGVPQSNDEDTGTTNTGGPKKPGTKTAAPLSKEPAGPTTTLVISKPAPLTLVGN